MTLDFGPVSVVTIEASKGDWAPVESLIARLPVDSGAAFIVKAAPEPDDRDRRWGALLAHCPLPVELMSPATELRPNRVYVRPAAREGASIEETAAERRRFLSGLVHEIRTPLAIILGTTELLAGDEIQGSSRRYLQTLRRAGRALERVVDGVSDASLGEAGGVRAPEPGSDEPLPSLDGLRVMVVDDSEDGRHLIGRILEREGARVTLLEHGGPVLEELGREAVDLVLMDVHMPEVDGVAATERIRDGDASYGSVPILGITAHATAENAERMKLAGADDVVARPIAAAELVRAVARLARRTRAGSDAAT